MTELRRNTGSPVTGTVSRARSPTYGSCMGGKECIRAQARTKSADERYRRVNPPGSGFLGDDLLKGKSSCNRSRSFERPGSARANLKIPSIIVTGVNSSSNHTVHISKKNNKSDTILSNPRSRSSSPFDWIEREKLPCGSPTFERVKSDMLSDSENSPVNSDTESSKGQPTQVKKKTAKRTSKTFQNYSYRNKARSKFKY